MDPVLYLFDPGFTGCMGERALLEEGKTNVKDESTLIAQEKGRREITEKKARSSKTGKDRREHKEQRRGGQTQALPWWREGGSYQRLAVPGSEPRIAPLTVGSMSHCVPSGPLSSRGWPPTCLSLPSPLPPPFGGVSVWPFVLEGCCTSQFHPTQGAVRYLAVAATSPVLLMGLGMLFPRYEVEQRRVFCGPTRQRRKTHPTQNKKRKDSYYMSAFISTRRAPPSVAPFHA